MVKSILWKFLSVEPFCSTSRQNQFLGIQEITRVSKQLSLRTRFLWNLILNFESSFCIWWKDTNTKSCPFFLPGDIFWFRTEYYFSQQFCLQLNENTNCTLISLQRWKLSFHSQSTFLFPSLHLYTIMCWPLAGIRHIYSHVCTTNFSDSGYPYSPARAARLLYTEGRATKIPYTWS